MRSWIAGIQACAVAAVVGAGVRSSAQGVSEPVYQHACVAADHALASEAGLQMLRKGGNAVDAAVATSFALSVVRPYSCGIGGGGFMVIHLKKPGKGPDTGPITIAIDYRETAIAGAGPEMFETDPDPDASTHGGKAVGVPGTVAGLLLALEKYGRLDRATVLAPAIKLAEEGFTVDAHYAHVSHTDELVMPWFRARPERAQRFAFLWDRFLKHGEVKVGDRILVPEQAKVLRLIARRGADGFYAGEVGEAIVDAVKTSGGAMTLADLAAYRPVEREPLRASFRGNTLVTMPPPSSGGIVLAHVLGMLESRQADLQGAERAPAPEGGHEGAAYVHLVTESLKHAFADRARWLEDPGYAHVPTAGLLKPEYIKDRAGAINMDHTLAPEAYGTATPPPDDGGTSHLSVVDADGSAVACTETINLIFGSMVAVEPYGFILNNEMDDFLARRGHANAFGLSHADLNRPEPGKRPLSCMTPTVVLGPTNEVKLVVGGSGGPRIITGTLEAALNVLVWDMSAEKAVRSARFHHQWKPDRLDLEPALRGEALEQALARRGHAIGEREAVGNIQLIRWNPGGGWQAASDPRKGGVPAGY